MRRAGIAFGLVVAVGAAYLLGRAGRAADPGPAAQQGGEASASQERGLVAAIRTLNERVARLEQEQHHANPPTGTAPTTAPDGEAPEDEEAVREAERAQAAAQASSLESELRAEPVDRRWAAEAEGAIRRPFDAGLFPGATIERVECASRLCRVDVATAGAAEGIRMMRELPLRTPFLPSAHIERVSDERAIVYFGRTGQEIGRVVTPDGL